MSNDSQPPDETPEPEPPARRLDHLQDLPRDGLGYEIYKLVTSVSREILASKPQGETHIAEGETDPPTPETDE